MATTTVRTEPRVSAVSATASRMEGIDISPSMTRISTASRMRTKPDTTPISTPSTADSAATAKPTHSETRAPYRVRE